MWKLLTRAFQWCILRGGQHLVEVSQNEDFLQKTAWKTAFLRDTKSDQLTLSSHNSCSKPPNLKNYHIFGILRTSAFRWAIGKPAGVNIVRLAAAWNFLPEGHQKLTKTDIFCFSANYLRFWYWNTYPGYHHVKADVLRIPKMYKIRWFRGFEQELWLLKVTWSRFVSPKKAVFEAVFCRKWLLTAKPSTFDYIVLYIVGKLWISAFSWYFWKNISWILQSVRILMTHPDRYFPLYWDLVIYI